MLCPNLYVFFIHLKFGNISKAFIKREKRAKFVLNICLNDFNVRITATLNNIVKSQPGFTYSKLTIETLERRRSDIFIVNFEHISRLFLVFYC